MTRKFLLWLSLAAAQSFVACEYRLSRCETDEDCRARHGNDLPHVHHYCHPKFNTCFHTSRNGGDAGLGGGRDGGEDGSKDAGSSGGVDAGLRTVTLIGVRRHVSDLGFFDVPLDLSDAGYMAYVPEPDGGFRMLEVTQLDSGHAEITNVPEGYYLLRMGKNWLETSESMVDLSYVQPGRPDISWADAGTRIVLDVTNLRPWNLGDDLSITAAGAALVSYPASRNATAEPDAGATAHRFDVMYVAIAPLWERVPIIDSSKGDQLVLTQLSYGCGSSATRGFARDVWGLRAET